MLNCYLKKCFTGIIVMGLLLTKTSYAALQDTTARAGQAVAGGVSGVVVDQDNRPLKDVKVSVKNAAGAAQSDDNGAYKIAANAGDVLVFEHPNHYAAVVTVKTDTVNVRLLDRFIQKKDEVDVLYGTQKRESMVGAVSTVYTNQLTTTPASLYVYALPGQLAGLYTNQTSGFASLNNLNPLTGFLSADPVLATRNSIAPSDNTEMGMQIRGQGVTVIVDGIQRDITSIDPESIESISVLKDATSTVFLGINSSKNILLVTTKKPELGDPKITFTAQTALQQSMGQPKDALPAYQWAYLYNEALQNDGQTPLYNSADIAAYRDHTDPYGHPDVDWYNTILKRNSALRSYKLNISGGIPVARYVVALNYTNQDGIFREASDAPYSTNNALSRYVLNSNISVNVTKNLVVDLQLYGRIQQINQPGKGYSTLLSQVFTTPANVYPLRNPDNSFGASNLGADYSNNLLAQSQYAGYNITKTNTVLANLNLNYDFSEFVKGLSFKAQSNIAIESQVYVDRSLTNATFAYNAATDRYASITSPAAQSNTFSTIISSRYVYTQAGLAYNRTFGKNNIGAQVFYDMRSLALTYDLTAVTINRAAKLTYNFDEKYFAEGTLNYSGFNRYAPGQRNGYFYAGGIGWLMSKESFIKDNVSWIDQWKWRASYGQTGNNNVGYYVYRQGFQDGGGYSQGINYATGSGVQEVTPLANPNVTWEKAHKLNIGTDIQLFKNISLTADYFRDNYYDVLGQRGNSLAILGAAYPDENIRKQLYTGYELSVTYQNHINNFNYFVTGNGNMVKTELTFFDEANQRNPWNVRTGLPLSTIYGYQSLGFFTAEDVANGYPSITGSTPQAGDRKFADLDNNGVIDQFDQKAIGGLKPLYYYGLTGGFNYKGFNFSFIIQGVFNRDITFNSRYTVPFQGVGFVGTAPYGQSYGNAFARWTPETAATATMPRLSLAQVSLGASNINLQQSTADVKSGDYVRLKNVEVGYSLPNSWIRKINVSGLRIFANGQNLYTIAGFRGFDGMDPEVYGLGAYPLQRVFNAGVTIKL